MKASLLFESLRPTGDERTSFRIEDPDEILTCSRLEEVGPLLHEVEQRARDGCLAAGFVSYEAGFAFLPCMPGRRHLSVPLAWFAITRKPHFLNPEEPLLPDGLPEVTNLRLNRTLEEYCEALRRIKQRIERGDTYQVNYTMRYRGGFRGSAEALYQRLRSRQRVNYAALIQTPDWAVISLSPELFFRKSGNRVVMRPMKGTAARGRTVREDETQARALRESPKETSENLMIVDLLRSDLGKICEPGSIQVHDAMRVERYETLLQMTTTIEGQLLENCGTAAVFAATFPSGSVTGAPKIRTMQIIDEVEGEPRGVYTGAIGFLHGNDSVFNVAIRTVCIDRAKGTLEMGAGSGILHEADAEREYRECALKARFLSETHRPFRLFETLLWTPQQGFARLDLHLDRILESAEYFLFPANREALRQALMVKFPSPHRVRLILDERGQIEIQHEPLFPLPDRPRVCLARQSTNSADSFLFHKTTNRELYEQELNHARSRGFYDVIFCNERGEITESAISNIVLRKGNEYFTPPVECGLLPGTFRRHLLEARFLPISERVLALQDLVEADAIFLTNALRGLLEVAFDTTFATESSHLSDAEA